MAYGHTLLRVVLTQFAALQRIRPEKCQRDCSQYDDRHDKTNKSTRSQELSESLTYR